VEIALTAAGDSRERDRWIAHQRGRLLRIANSVLHDREEAEDVVQETWLGFVRASRRGTIRSPAAYLSRAVRWNAVKRRARRVQHASLDALPEPSGDENPNHLHAVELERAIATLPLAQQTVIRLRFYLGLSFREIGKNLSISTNTAASRTRYALANLRRRLGSTADQSSKEGPHE
jgi:RNA polymerase sigma-70 factor (ECF subfamily)